MAALMRYQLVYYMRSYRYLAPLLAYVGLILFVYSLVPNPVMGSYAFSAAWLFVVSAWLTFGYLDLEHAVQQKVTIIQAGSLNRYIMSKLLLLACIGVVLSVLTLLYPALCHKFDRAPSGEELAIALAAHVILSLLGVGVAVFFTEKGWGLRKTALPGLVVAIVLALAGASAADAWPQGLQGLKWLLPPAYEVVDRMMKYDTHT